MPPTILVRAPGRGRRGLAVVRRRRSALATGAAVGSLAALNLARHRRESTDIVLGVGSAAALLAGARVCGLSWSELGLGRDRLRAGLLWGGGAGLAVGAVYLVGVTVPGTRGAFLDERYQLDPPEALRTALVAIPLGTVVLEEVAFRSVLPGLLEGQVGSPGAALVSSGLFGLWHVLPSLELAAARGPSDGDEARSTVLVVIGTVAFTALGGVVATELRRRSGSVLASAGMHWATNGLGVLFGLLARRVTR